MGFAFGRSLACMGWPGGLAFLVASWVAGAAPAVIEGRGLANASAAVRIGSHRILVGSDEHNALLLYDVRTGGRPLKSFPTGPWLDLEPDAREADFEGAARIGDTLYWIGSHSRNRQGKVRSERQRLLALRVADEDGDVRLSPMGPPLTTLLQSLCSTPGLADFGLGAAARLEPKEPGGLNIEGLAATPEGGLYIGFRSPVPDGKALMALLMNPAELIAGRPARWGPPARLDLGGQGIRDAVWSGRRYYLLGGSPGEGGRTQLYRWAGPGVAPEVLKSPGLKNLNAEGMVIFGTPARPRLLVLSDDGNRRVNAGKEAQDRTFRMLWVDLPPENGP
ncbi:MAG: DUF3616 domain-containing protein [Verrucomicrobiae bacterium]|nr:DUF3616 domain-containing protein [Verrucomicrobiae bacterium]